jgi:hypothetical protein
VEVGLSLSRELPALLGFWASRLLPFGKHWFRAPSTSFG